VAIVLTLVALLAQDDAATAGKFLKAAHFPSAKSQDEWARKSEEYAAVVKLCVDRERWTAALKRIVDAAGPVSDAWTLNVSFMEAEGDALADSIRLDKKCIVRFNLRRLAKSERSASEIEGVIVHELTHLLQGTAAVPSWFAEGLASYFEGAADRIAGFLKEAKTIESVDATGVDPYARGALFFRWLETKVGAAKLKELVKAVYADEAGYRKTLEKIAGLKWEKLLAEELEAARKR